MSNCNTDSIRDYAFDELPAPERQALERHISGCAHCAAELDQLRLTTAALRVLPDREPPRRIAFVSDARPSRSWSFAPWLGFASAAIMAAALVITASARPVEIRTVTVQPQPVDEAIRKAVAQARDEDAKIFNAALKASDAKHDRQLSIMMDAVALMQQGNRTADLQVAGQ